jgi:DNA-directed RNA polymerase specialized sigma24 family protein
VIEHLSDKNDVEGNRRRQAGASPGQEREIVRTILAQMKPRTARLLILRHSGLSYTELAEALGIAPGSIGTLLARAEAEFAGRLKEMEEK